MHSQGGPTLISDPRRSTRVTRRQVVVNAPKRARMELPGRILTVDFVKLPGLRKHVFTTCLAKVFKARQRLDEGKEGHEASGAAYASTLALIYPILGNSRRKGSSSGRRADSDMSSDPRMPTNGIDGLAAAGHAFHESRHG